MQPKMFPPNKPGGVSPGGVPFSGALASLLPEDPEVIASCVRQQQQHLRRSRWDFSGILT